MALSRVLLIDDDDAFRSAMAKALRRKGIEVVQAAQGAAGVALLMNPEPPLAQVAVLDLRMPDMDGIEVLERTGGRRIPVVVLTGHGTIPDAVKAMRLGAFSFLIKPVDADQLYEVLLQATGEAGSLATTLLGASSFTERLRDLLNQLAPADDPVLLFGETGTGKEVAANYLHLQSPRASRPFVGVNLGGLPGELLESELFGHARGAFTGADRRKNGLFAAAEDGTLFLDEISELPLEYQVKLLRVIETRRYRPLGEAREEPLRARLVAATNRNLMAMVRAGTFREDLYYRLQVLPVEIPPLRARREDILPIAEHWLKRLLHRPVTFSIEAQQRLVEYSYPGNVRELVNVVRRLALFVKGDQVEGALVQRMLAEDPFRATHGAQGLLTPPGTLATPGTLANTGALGAFPASGLVAGPVYPAGYPKGYSPELGAQSPTGAFVSPTAASAARAQVPEAQRSMAEESDDPEGGSSQKLSLRRMEKLHIERLLHEHRNVSLVARLLGIDRRTLQRKMKSLEIEYEGRDV